MLLATDAGFPSVLAALTPTLWLRGQASALAITPRVTVVGSRDASALGLKRAQALGRALAERGVLVISGGALGIDAAAHQGALAAGGRTCAVLGTGVDISYPARHAELFEAITQRGCLVSMLDLGAPPARPHFPQRNELMAALADLVVVVEARLHSGTESTALAARKHGRRVVCFPDSPGTQVLAQKGATAVGSVAEVLALIGLSTTNSDVPVREPAAESDAAQDDDLELLPLSENAAPLLGVLCKDPLDLGELCARARLSAAECAAALIELELRGQCSRLPGGRYIGHSPLS